MRDAGARAIVEQLAAWYEGHVLSASPALQDEATRLIAAALAREAEVRAYLEGERASVCDLLNAALRDTQLAEQQVAPERLKTGIEALWFRLNETYAARVRAEGERDGADNGCAILRGHYDNAIKGATHWRERVAALEAALREYGQHEPDCSLGKSGHPREGECDCGLDAALAPPERSRVAAPAEDAREAQDAPGD